MKARPDPTNRTPLPAGANAPVPGASPAAGASALSTMLRGLLPPGAVELAGRLAALPAKLSSRERLLVGALAGVLVLAAVYGIGHGLSAYQNDLAERLQSTRDQIAELRQLGPATARTAGLGTRTLAATLEELVSRTGMRDRLQLNPVTQEGAGRPQAMEIKADRLTLDEAVRLIYTLESPDAPVAVDQFEVAPSFQDKELLRVSVRVVGRI